MKAKSIYGAGLGLRRDFMEEVITQPNLAVDFFEIAPENWLKMGGKYAKQLSVLTQIHPFVCHGLSLDIGGPRPLDTRYIQQLKVFFEHHNIRIYSEHLSFCGDQGHLYDLMPIPFTSEAVSYVAQRIRHVQELLERKIAIENVSFYTLPSQEMTESEFINAVLQEADCDLLLDVNNTYVNSVNFQYNPHEFIAAMPTERIAYLHMAGHFDEADDLKIDTHGQPVKQEVWNLLDFTYASHGVLPTLLERDFNIPSLSELITEVDRIRHAQNVCLAKQSKTP